MTIFGQPLQDILIPPILRGNNSTGASLKDILVGDGAVLGIVPYYTIILSAIAAFVAFCYIIKAGYMMFTAFGDEAKYAAAKKTLQYALIGFAIAVLSYFIIHFFVGLLGYTGTG
ncbi:MAG: hypothetical protein AAB774_00640 [Patescibacteria group bacterium]